MKIWVIIRTDNKIRREGIYESLALDLDEAAFLTLLTQICSELDISRPVLLKKHLKELKEFSRTVFYPQDFMEPVAFDRFELELFS